MESLFGWICMVCWILIGIGTAVVIFRSRKNHKLGKTNDPEKFAEINNLLGQIANQKEPRLGRKPRWRIDYIVRRDELAHDSHSTIWFEHPATKSAVDYIEGLMEGLYHCNVREITICKEDGSLW